MKNPLAQVREILSTALGSASESPAIIEEIHGFILDWFKNNSIIQHYDDNPDRHDAVVAAVILQKTLPTPASTPRGDTISPQTPPRRIIQEFESGQGSAAQHAALIPSSHQQDEDSCRESSEGVAGGGQPYQACCEVAEESIPEQTAGAFPVATPKDCVLADTDGGPEHSAPQRDGRLSRQAAQVAATLISQQLDTPNYRPRKRKYAPEVSDASNATLTTASDAAVTGTESPGPDVPRLCDSPSPPSRNDNSHDNQSHLSRSDRGCIPVSPVASSLSSPSPLEIVGSPAPSPCEGQPSAPDVLPAEFAVLREDLRAKGPMIGNEETVEHLWHVVNYMKASDASPVGSDPSVEASSTSATDERLRVLKTCITREEQNEERLKSAKSLARLRKRVYLVELIGNYIDEKEVWNAWKAEPRRKRRKIGRRLSPLGRYTNLLFPETMGWRDTRLGTTKAAKAALRQQAKNKLEYWVSLGEPLVMLARRYGVGVLAVLPKKMTDRGLHNLRRSELDVFLHYIDFLHPELKERVSNLSGLLPRILQNGLPSGKLVLETYTADRLNELRDRSLNELFQFAITLPVDTVMEPRSDQMDTPGSSNLSMASSGADEHPIDGEAQFHSCITQHRPQGQPYQTEEAGGRPDPSISESLELQSIGSPAINLHPGEWRPMDPIESIASRSSLAGPLSQTSVSEASRTDMAPEDMSVDMHPHHDLSQPAFPAVLPGTPTMEPGLGANYLTWDSNAGADTRFHYPGQYPNLDNIYLSSPIVSPTLLPSPQTTADDAPLQDVSYAYSAPFFL